MGTHMPFIIEADAFAAHTFKPFDELLRRIESRRAVVGIIGLGYVGLPLAMAVARARFPIVGFDIDPAKIAKLNGGISYIDAAPSAALADFVSEKRFEATTDFARLGECDVIVICVPTPLSKNREPDLSFIESTVQMIAGTLRPGQAIVLESTTYLGTTNDLVIPMLEEAGLKSGHDFFVGFSPEREDPGNARFHTASIPKIVSGDGEEAARIVKGFYDAVVEKTVLVSSPRTAEAVKITENVFRAVNVALVNELKVIFKAMDVDVWEVIDAAATKPFGFMPFYPGPGLGGHCIPIDPFYLTWRAREFGIATRFIELAREINVAMPTYVVGQLDEALDRLAGKSLSMSKILMLGIAYKKNVSDMRESPALHIMDMLVKRGADVDFHDPHVLQIPSTREHARLAGRKTVALTDRTLDQYDAVLVTTDHDNVDYALVAARAKLVVDTRNVMERRGLSPQALIKA
jgi:UDP-N-acetyl-D-glucosamine dehydrogenase